MRLRGLAQIAIMDKICAGASAMKTMSAKDAKNAFGLLLDTARAEPVTVEKHGRPVVVVLSVEEFERLNRQQDPEKSSRRDLSIAEERSMWGNAMFCEQRPSNRERHRPVSRRSPPCRLGGGSAE